MSTEQNKMLVRRWFKEVLEQRNLALADELFSADYANHDPQTPPSGAPRGPQVAKAIVATYKGAFPDATYSLEEQLADGDRVVTRWSVQGTHTGSLFGMPPTGKKVHATGITIDRIANGKIVESYSNADMLGPLQQIGAIPALGGGL